MLKYSLADLSETSLEALANNQIKVDEQPTLELKVARATSLFNAKTPAAAFAEVRTALEASAPPGEACYYCERDRWREIEHVRPKRFYPEHCFNWNNYVYSCTICNQDYKKDRYGVIDDHGILVEFDRSRPYADGTPKGSHAFLNPREEDPLDFLILDLETGGFSPISDDPLVRLRVDFTKSMFDLDSDDLRRARRQAYKAFSLYISEYNDAIGAEDGDRADRILQEIRELPHPTVLVEMRRQSSEIKFLEILLEKLPQDLGERP